MQLAIARFFFNRIWGSDGEVKSVVSWKPWYHNQGIEWPVMRVKHKDGSHVTCVPVWNKVWLKNFILRNR